MCCNICIPRPLGAEVVGSSGLSSAVGSMNLSMCTACLGKENAPLPPPFKDSTGVVLWDIFSSAGSAGTKHAVKKVPLPTKKRQRVKKSVRFCRLYNKTYTRHASSEDLQRSWNQPEDYRKIKVEARKSVLQRETKEGDCIRGLESFVSEDVRDMRRQWINKTIQSVLVKQDIQKLLGLSNPDQLSEASAAASQPSQICAMVLAAIDQKERYS